MTNYDARQYVEQFHLLFLDQLGRKLDKTLYALKGGCNLRFYFQSIRYSEDIDLDVQRIGKEDLQAVVRGILKSRPFEQILQVRTFRIGRLSEPKQTETTQRWKLGFSVGDSDVLLPTKIEFSRRGMKADTLFEAVDPGLIGTYQLPSIMANHYSAHTAYQQKVEAVVTRSTPQARDVFDLNLLLNAGVGREIPEGSLKRRLPEAEARVMTIAFEQFKSQVLSYLHPEHQAQYASESLWEDMVLNVAEAIHEQCS